MAVRHGSLENTDATTTTPTTSTDFHHHGDRVPTAPASYPLLSNLPKTPVLFVLHAATAGRPVAGSMKPQRRRNGCRYCRKEDAQEEAGGGIGASVSPTSRRDMFRFDVFQREENVDGAGIGHDDVVRVYIVAICGGKGER